MPESSAVHAQLIERLRKHVDILAEVIGPRHLGRPKELAAAAGYIEREFVALEDPVERQTYDVEDATATNLIVERRGQRHPNSIILITINRPIAPTRSILSGWHRSAWE